MMWSYPESQLADTAGALPATSDQTSRARTDLLAQRKHHGGSSPTRCGAARLKGRLIGDQPAEDDPRHADPFVADGGDELIDLVVAALGLLRLNANDGQCGGWMRRGSGQYHLHITLNGRYMERT